MWSSFPYHFQTYLNLNEDRPALIVQHFDGEDLLLAQITSKNARDEFAVSLREKDFKEGSLNKPSNIRTNKLFTCSRNLILYKVGNLGNSKMDKVIETIVELIKQ